jgi:hypothetical protein
MTRRANLCARLQYVERRLCTIIQTGDEFSAPEFIARNHISVIISLMKSQGEQKSESSTPRTGGSQGEGRVLFHKKKFQTGKSHAGIL